MRYEEVIKYCKFIESHEAEIRRYCAENNLSFSKLISSGLSWGAEDVFVLYDEPNSERAKLGLLDDVPASILLEIYLENGKLRFVQTDITHKYLGVDRKTEKPAVAKRPASRELAFA